MILGVDGVQAESEFVIQAGVHAVKCERKVFRLAIAACNGKSQVESSSPPMLQPGMQRLLVSRLFDVVANECDIGGCGFHRAALGSHVELSAICADGPNQRLASFQADVKLLLGLDVLNAGKLNRKVALRVGMQNNRFPVAFDYGAGEVIAVFQRDLIGCQCPRQN